MASFTAPVTAVSEIPSIVQRCRVAFNQGKMETADQRKTVLRALLKMINENYEAIYDAAHKDLGRSKYETHMMEISIILNEIVYMLQHLDTLMAPKAAAAEGMMRAMTLQVHKDPLGVVLILGAWNYPMLLILSGLAGALAAGNTAVVKPSELSPHSAQLMTELLAKYIDADVVGVVNGAVQESTAVLKERFDHIMYTGGAMVAKIVMAAAAVHLTPVTLELGGKSPTIVDATCANDIDTVAKRILWAKYTNSGQTCIAPDYVLIHKDVKPAFIEAFKTARAAFMLSDGRTDVLTDPNYGCIVNERHFDRVRSLLSGGEVVVGGEVEKETRKIAPTLLDQVDLTHPLMTDEIFGPLLPMVTWEKSEDVIAFIRAREKPLALYCFTNDKAFSKLIGLRTSSGAYLVNELMLHGGITAIPFGGVGNSGMGRYHGHYTFETFTHEKAVMIEGMGMESIKSIRYPPYTEKNLSWYRRALESNKESCCTMM